MLSTQESVQTRFLLHEKQEVVLLEDKYQPMETTTIYKLPPNLLHTIISLASITTLIQ